MPKHGKYPSLSSNAIKKCTDHFSLAATAPVVHQKLSVRGDVTKVFVLVLGLDFREELGRHRASADLML